MSSQTAAQQSPIQSAVGQEGWSISTRIVFRFAFVYLALHAFALLGMFARDALHDRFLFAAHEKFWLGGLSLWAAKHVFGTSDFDAGFFGSDSLLSWVRVGWLLMIAAVAATFWSVVDRKRKHYGMLDEWLRLLVRFGLGLTMVSYGAEKIWPAQFPLTRPHQLLGEFGFYTPQQLLWAFIGSSRGYETFTGVVELLGGALLFVPRLTTLGALVTAAATTNVFLLNVFYDVMVKLGSLHLLLMALFLLVPDVQRLADVFLFNRSTAPAERPPLFRRKRLAQAALIVQIAIGIAATGQSLLLAKLDVNGMNVFDTTRVPFYGIWDVEEFSLDGIPRSPLTTDELRWQRVVFDSPYAASIQRMSGAVIGARLRTDLKRAMMAFDRTSDVDPFFAGVHDGTTVELREMFGPKWKAEFKFETPSSDLILLHGRYNGRPAELKLRRDQTHFLLKPHETRWVLRGHPESPYF